MGGSSSRPFRVSGGDTALYSLASQMREVEPFSGVANNTNKSMQYRIAEFLSSRTCHLFAIDCERLLRKRQSVFTGSAGGDFFNRATPM